MLKELADFDFSCLPDLSKQQVLDLARGEYLEKAESILMIGNPGLGKTHIATGLAVAGLSARSSGPFLQRGRSGQ